MMYLWCFYPFWTSIAPGDHMHSLYGKGHNSIHLLLWLEEIKSWSWVIDDRIVILFNSMWSVTYYPNVPKHIVKELVSVCWKFHRLWACVLFRRQERLGSLMLLLWIYFHSAKNISLPSLFKNREASKTLGNI